MCTVLNKNVWPFPSLNVFSELPKEKSGQWIIRITSGNEIYDLDPGNVLPMEFFMARSVVGDAALSRDEVKLDALLDYINHHLEESHFAFDERWEKVKINPGSFTQIQIVLKVSKIEQQEKYETHPSIEYIAAEKSYVR